MRGSSTSQNPVHTLLTPGIYSVSLAATNATGLARGTCPGSSRCSTATNLLATTNLGGSRFMTVGSRQEIALDTTKMVSDTFNPGGPCILHLHPPAIERMGEDDLLFV